MAFSKASWTAPVSNDAVTISFKQHISANEPLRTGSYSKTLTFTCPHEPVADPPIGDRVANPQLPLAERRHLDVDGLAVALRWASASASSSWSVERML